MATFLIYDIMNCASSAKRILRLFLGFTTKNASCVYFHKYNDVDYITRTNGDILLHGVAIRRERSQSGGRKRMMACSQIDKILLKDCD